MTDPAPIRSRLPLPRRGVEIALLDWGGEGPLLLMHHANGFCAATLGLVAQGLRERYRVIGMDARGHGDSSKPEAPEGYSWNAFAEDLLAVAEVLADEGGEGRVAVGLGHSFGGTSMLGAAARRSDLFGHLVLVDPVIPLRGSRRVADPERAGRVSRLEDGARQRRSEWPSRAEARAHFATRSLFADWDPRALDLYVEEGLYRHGDGRVELKCPGVVEATVFARGGEIDVAALARRVRTPADFLWATRGDFPRPVYEAVVATMPDARIVDLDAGHLAPMEQPKLVVEAVLAATDRGSQGSVG